MTFTDLFFRNKITLNKKTWVYLPEPQSKRKTIYKSYCSRLKYRGREPLSEEECLKLYRGKWGSKILPEMRPDAKGDTTPIRKIIDDNPLIVLTMNERNMNIYMENNFSTDLELRPFVKTLFDLAKELGIPTKKIKYTKEFAKYLITSINNYNKNNSH